ncbi:T-complex protein 11-like protein 1 isoform X2 [Gasterosteus aculeatus]
MQQSVEYERSKFQGFLEKHPNALDYTEKWLEDTLRCMRERDPCAPSSGPLPRQRRQLPPPADVVPRLRPLPRGGRITARSPSVLRPVSSPHAPLQTVLMDQVRFQEMHREERLVMLSSVLFIVYTTTGEAIFGLLGLMEKLKDIVSSIFTDMHTP